MICSEGGIQWRKMSRCPEMTERVDEVDGCPWNFPTFSWFFFRIREKRLREDTFPMPYILDDQELRQRTEKPLFNLHEIQFLPSRNEAPFVSQLTFTVSRWYNFLKAKKFYMEKKHIFQRDPFAIQSIMYTMIQSMWPTVTIRNLRFELPYLQFQEISNGRSHWRNPF